MLVSSESSWDVFTIVLSSYLCAYLLFVSLILRTDSHQASLCVLQRDACVSILMHCIPVPVKTAIVAHTNEEMGCFPTRECQQWSDDELDLDDTPLLNETSRSEDFIRENHVMSRNHDRKNNATDPRLEHFCLNSSTLRA